VVSGAPGDVRMPGASVALGARPPRLGAGVGAGVGLAGAMVCATGGCSGASVVFWWVAA